MGLLRMVHAGKLQSIEEALASLAGPGSSSGSPAGPSGATGGGRPARPAGDPPASRFSAPAPPVRTPIQQAPPPTPAAMESAPTTESGDLRTRLHAAFLEARQMHIADAVENAHIAEAGAELIVTAPKMYAMYFKEAAFEAAVRKIAGKALKITIKTGEAGAGQAPVAAAAPKRDDEVTERALSNSEVKRFQELFPEAQVRTVRNLKND
jgi:hypothetical protein